MKKILIVAAVVMVLVLIGMQSPQKALAQASGVKVYEAAKGEIFPVTDPAAIASLETRTLNKQCTLIAIGPKTRAAVAGKSAIRLYVCGSSVEPYCVTQSGKRVCYPPQP